MSGYADSVTQILLRRGEAEARAEIDKGNAYAGMAQQLGQIPGQVQQMQAQQQHKALVDQQIASGKAQEAQRLADVETKDRAAKLTQTVDRIYQTAFTDDPETGISTFDRKKVEDGLLKSGNGHLYPTMVEHLDKLDASARAIAGERRVMVARSLQAIADGGYTPEAVATQAAYLKKNGAVTDDHLAPMLQTAAGDPSPDNIKAMVTRMGASLPEYRQLQQAEEKRQTDLAKTRAETANLAPKGFDLSPGQVRFDADGGEVARVDPKPEHSPQYKEWQDYTAQGGKLSFNDYANMDANRHRPVSITNAATDDKMIAETARNILANPRDLTSVKSITTLRGDQRLKLFNELKRQNPDFNVGNIDRQIKFLDSYEDPKGKAALNRGSMNNILQHAADLSTVNQEYRRTNLRIVNTPIAALAKQNGTEWQQFATPLAVLKDEIGLYFAGGYAPTADQQKTWDRIANDSATPAQIEQFAKDIIHVGLRRADTHNEGFKTVMGYDDPNLITPAAVQAGERLGLGASVKKYGSGGTLGTKPPPAGAPTGRIRVKGPNGETGTMPAGSTLAAGWTKVG